MKNTFAAIKFWMDKILSIACAVLLTFMTVLVLIRFSPAISSTAPWLSPRSLSATA